MEESYSMFTKDALLSESASNEPKSELKAEDLKNQLSIFAGEFKKYKDAGKPHPVFAILNEKISGNTALVSIAYNQEKGGRKRIDFELVNESSGRKIKKMDGYGFVFQ